MSDKHMPDRRGSHAPANPAPDHAPLDNAPLTQASGRAASARASAERAAIERAALKQASIEQAAIQRAAAGHAAARQAELDQAALERAAHERAVAEREALIERVALERAAAIRRAAALEQAALERAAVERAAAGRGAAGRTAAHATAGQAAAATPAAANAWVDSASDDHRREPTMGRMDDVVFRNRTGAGASARAGGTRWRAWHGWLALVVVAIAAVIAFRQPIADRLWPDTRAQELRALADAALARQHLSASDGSGARELYEAALAIDPDRSEARAGLMRVAHAAIAKARVAMMAGRFGEAHDNLRLARALAVPRGEIATVAADLQRREAAHAGIDGLLAKAHAARAKGRLDGTADAALPLYRRVLELQPERTAALEGREDALGDLLQQAGKALERGDLAAGASAIAAARSYDPGHADLPASEVRLGREIERMRQRADVDLRAGRLDRAGSGYRAVLEIDADDATARQGIERVGLSWAARAEQLAGDFEFSNAQVALRQAQALAPASTAVREATRHLQRARQSQARLQPAMPARQRDRRVEQLLAEAAAASARGDLLAPPGDSAYDKLRAARALAPASAAVRSASARLLPAARACFETELRGNNLTRARACLDAQGVLEGNDAALVQARHRLAQRWLAVGDERLGAGEVALAASALNEALNLDRAAPGLDAFAERVRAASAGHR